MTKVAIKVLAIAISISVLLGVTSAFATRTVTITSHISIKSKSLTFSGRVTAKNAACDAGRKVTLYRTSALKLGSATTSSSGHWKITASGSAGISLGHFYAKVAKRSEGTAGTIYVCTAAKSKTIALHQ
jgi:Hemagglutinin repeat